MRLRRCKLITLVLFLALTSQAFALEWYKAYMKGQEAIKSGNCASGQALMLEALQQNPKAGLKVPAYGTFRMEYIPHFYLAQCAFQSGDVAAANQYLKQAETGDVASSSKAKEYAALKSAIEAKLQEKQRASSSTTPQPPANTNPPQVNAPNTTDRAVVSQPSASDAQQRAQVAQQALINRTLQQAGSALNAGQYVAATDAANRVLLLNPDNPAALRILQEIRRQVNEASRKERQQGTDEVNQAIRRGDLDTAQTLLLKLQLRYPSDPGIESLAQDIQKRKEADFRSSQEVELKKTTERLVLVAYYRGQYQAVIELVQQGLQRDSENWRLHFYLGCAYAALSMLDEGNRNARLKLARESFRKARQVTSSLTIPPYISPKIIEIYKAS